MQINKFNAYSPMINRNQKANVKKDEQFKPAFGMRLELAPITEKGFLAKYGEEVVNAIKSQLESINKNDVDKIFRTKINDKRKSLIAPQYHALKKHLPGYDDAVLQVEAKVAKYNERDGRYIENVKGGIDGIDFIIGGENAPFKNRGESIKSVAGWVLDKTETFSDPKVMAEATESSVKDALSQYAYEAVDGDNFIYISDPRPGGRWYIK